MYVARNSMSEVISGYGKPEEGGRGTPLYGLNRYVRRQRVWFLAVLVWNRVSIVTILVWNRVWFVLSSFELAAHYATCLIV